MEFCPFLPEKRRSWNGNPPCDLDFPLPYDAISILFARRHKIIPKGLVDAAGFGTWVDQKVEPCQRIGRLFRLNFQPALGAFWPAAHALVWCPITYHHSGIEAGDQRNGSYQPVF